MKQSSLSRRSFIYAVGATGTTTLVAGCLEDDEDDTPETVDAPSDVDGHLEGANLYYGGLIERTDDEEVLVDVGAGENGQAFDPSAILIRPGTTVVWEWQIRGGLHDVIEENDEFDSSPRAIERDPFEHTFDEEGVYLYYCSMHGGNGMRGAVVVREEEEEDSVNN